MAKLSDLKALYDAGKAKSPEPEAPARPTGKAPAASATAVEAPAALPPVSVKRLVAAAKHADGDIDLDRAFADVEKLPASNRARIERALKAKRAP